MKPAVCPNRISLPFLLFLVLTLVACDNEPVVLTPPPSTPTILSTPTSTPNPPTLIPTSLAVVPTLPPTPASTATPDYAATSTAFVAQDPWKKVSVITDVAVLASAPGDFHTIYAGISHYLANASPGGMARSSDAGATWQTLPSAFRATHIAVAPSDPAIIYAGAKADCSKGIAGELYRTSDAGATWRLLSGSAYNIDINPSNPDHLVALQCEGPVRSLDGGMSWERLPSSGVADLSAAYMAREASDRSTIYVVYSNFTAYGGGGISSVVQRTIDDGRTWTNLPFRDCAFPYDLVLNPADARHIYLPCTSGFFVSTDAGDNWTAQNDGLHKDGMIDDPAPYPMSEIALDHISKPPSGASHMLYMFHVVFEVTRSLVRWDGVNTWEKVGDTPGYDPDVCCLLMLNDPSSPALLTATGEGIYKRILP
jgi:photosystem II stability/assembly factor-like uncharacterized protein